MVWFPTASTMPESGKRVLFAWINRNGKARVGAGSWHAANTTEACGYALEDDRCTYDEEHDVYYLPEGWREWGWEEEYAGEPDGPVTHWMPMPRHPNGQIDGGTP